MNCPTCNAKLLPIKGGLFCLQCGELVGESARMSDLQPRTGAKSAPLTARVPAAAGRIPALMPPALHALLPAHIRSGVTGWHRRFIPWTAIVILAVVTVLAVSEMSVRYYYRDRVYPGVKVGNVSLGGQALSKIDGVVKKALPTEPVSLSIGRSTYVFTPQELGATTNATALKASVQDAGRKSPLALLGVLQTLLSKPLRPEYQVDDAAAKSLAARLAVENSHPAVDARIMMVGATPLVVAEKAGQQVDPAKLHDSLVIALRNHQQLAVGAAKLAPSITAASYAADVQDAQTKIALNLTVKVKAKTVAVTSDQIAAWLSFGDPGSGAKVDAAKVGAFVNGITGTFDRPAAQAAIMAALQAKQPLAYAAPATRKSTKVNASGETPAPAAQTYSYCVAGRGVPAAELAAVTAKADTALNNLQGWALGGRLKFLSSSSNCNATIWLASARDMGSFDAACSNQSSCQVENNVVINTTNWSKSPSEWKGSLEDYRTELINHEMGHWLGFDHAKCTDAKVAAPLNQLTLNVSGCSAQWHAIPAELQGRKVLSGFE